eukprot:CAMPEP_0181326578 /NCGR_PEP_ID=MMETSP1101-20121128/21584_1 /TAXON_ID=46948 /ORGANISM="Rhodomonas abbreviata, Strain Caron Lab Isolate" /LENGTH=398 /DNA_ID=CAMNT_0023435063 /DNA_START=17 /DNA_END=1213 /DNA_ORIENTATION=+
MHSQHNMAEERDHRRIRRNSFIAAVKNSRRALFVVVPLIHIAGLGSNRAFAFQTALGGAAMLRGSPLLDHMSFTPRQFHDLKDNLRFQGIASLRSPPKTSLRMNAGIARMGALTTAAPLLLWKGYQHYLGLYPLEMDAMTGALLYILGKLTSNAITGDHCQKRVYGRWAVMGSLDGYFTHLWYVWIDMVTMFLASTPALKLFTMTIVTSFCYTPIYCAAFLLVMSTLEGKSFTNTVEKIKEDVMELSTLTIKTWMPLNVILFGLVPAAYRVLVSMLMNYVYLIGLAMWESGSLNLILDKFKRKPQETVAGADVEDMFPSAQPLLGTDIVHSTTPVDMVMQPAFAFDNGATPWEQPHMDPGGAPVPEPGLMADAPMDHSTVESPNYVNSAPLGNPTTFL